MHAKRARSGDGATSCPWVTSTASPAARAAMVVAKMSIQQLDDMVHRVPGPYEGNTMAIPSLCVPALSMSGGPDGAGPHLSGVTQLPDAASAAATWDPATVEQFGAVTGSELAGKGVDVELGPTVNIVRDPRWGRAFESYGEDPYLSGQIAAADIQGVQSQGPIAMVKHFALYNQETYRNTAKDDVIVSDRVAHEIYLPQFQAAIDQGGAGAVMCSYATINGVDACQDPYLTTILDDQWAFPGFVMSDGGATHSTVQAANAGLDDMESRGGQHFGAPLVRAVDNGQVALSTLKEMATRVLTTMFAFGLFNRPATGSINATVTSSAHAAEARAVADEGTVLLKDTGAVLPLAAGTPSIAVIGDDGGSGAIVAGTGSSHVVTPDLVTPYQGITAAAGAGTRVTYARGNSPSEPDGNPGLQAQAAAAARRATVAVVFAGLPEAEGSDLNNINLTTADNDLISAVAAANPNTVVVLNTGSAVTMPWLRSVKAVVEAWYPGQEDGNAIADILFGKVDPSGKLPVTFPVSLADVPASTPAQWPGVGGKVEYSEGLLVGYRWYDAKGITPLFPFGFGLSYTSFAFSNLVVAPTLAPGATATVSVDVTNTGRVTGAETVQAYVGDPASVGEPPEQLKGFDKVTLAPGQTATVSLPLGPQSFSTWDSATQSWTEATGQYSVMVGDSSSNLPEVATVAIG
ncbi:MAG: glycoside hydrolase family 3 C-terminal domain-containing protein [Acidimicrobiales bacterium]